MGAVYLGVSEAGARRAIKVPLFDGDVGGGQRARFEREAQTLARLKAHPNIVRVYSAGQDRGFAYCVLELVEGRGLDATLDEDGPLPIERALDLAIGIARALEHFRRGNVERWHASVGRRFAQTRPERTVTELNAEADKWRSPGAPNVARGATTPSSAAPDECDADGGNGDDDAGDDGDAQGSR
jgi:serine/threonine-protein kinase